jgi:hypothetical protein
MLQPLYPLRRVFLVSWEGHRVGCASAESSNPVRLVSLLLEFLVRETEYNGKKGRKNVQLDMN